MDAFYASVEQRDKPELQGKPIAVGGSPEGRGGVVATCSYEARKFGVRSAMSSKTARQLCPALIFVRPRFDAYKLVSQQIREIFERYTDLIEPLSLDEAYLDVTTDKQGIGSAIEIAKLIKQNIQTELKLTASAGVSVNKFIAKVASDMRKPNGLTFIGPSKVNAFIEKLPVEKFFGVGKVTAEKMRKLGLHTGADLKRLTESELVSFFGKSGRFYYNIVRGLDERPVRTSRQRKSVGAEDTFSHNLTTLEEMQQELEKIAVVLYKRLKKSDFFGRTITLKIKYHDFRVITRSKSFADPVDHWETLIQTAQQLLVSANLAQQKIRLLGLSMSNAGEREEKNEQPSLF